MARINQELTLAERNACLLLASERILSGARSQTPTSTDNWQVRFWHLQRITLAVALPPDTHVVVLCGLSGCNYLYSHRLHALHLHGGLAAQWLAAGASAR
jgi:hypothetical protein